VKKTKTKYLKPRVIECIKKNLSIINEFLKSIYSGFFHYEYSDEMKSLDLINFKKKKFFFVVDNREKGEEKTLEMQIFVINLEDEIIKNHNAKKEYIGCRVVSNGQIYAGKFNDEGKFNGPGIYISKKGNLVCGIFEDSDMKKGKMYTSNGIIYEGTLKNMKRHGKNQKEVKPGNYEFLGDFENDHRIKGKFTYDQTNEKFKHIRNAEIEDFSKFNHSLNDAYFSYPVKLRFKYKGKEHFYTGSVQNNKLSDENAVLISSKKGYPKYEGQIKYNGKEGKGSYWWNREDYYVGTFTGNKFHSTNYSGNIKEFFKNEGSNSPATKTLDGSSMINSNGRTYSVFYNKGELLGYLEIANVTSMKI